LRSVRIEELTLPVSMPMPVTLSLPLRHALLTVRWWLHLRLRLTVMPIHRSMLVVFAIPSLSNPSRTARSRIAVLRRYACHARSAVRSLSLSAISVHTVVLTLAIHLALRMLAVPIPTGWPSPTGAATHRSSTDSHANTSKRTA